MSRIFPIIKKTTTTVVVPSVSLSGTGGTFDGIVLSTTGSETGGLLESAVGPFAVVPSDVLGSSDVIPSVEATASSADLNGGWDSLVVRLSESAQSRSGTPDSDAWGDAWVNRAVGSTGDNHGNENTMIISAVTAVTRQDGYAKVNLTRFARLTGSSSESSLFSFTVDWPNIALNPSASLQVDLTSSDASPFTESTITAANRARFSSVSPFSQRIFSAGQDGVRRTHSFTLSADEVNNILNGGRWLMIQYTTSDLTAGVFNVLARESGSFYAFDVRAVR